MRNTIEIEDVLISDAMRLTGARTKKEVVRISLENIVRQKRRESLKRKLGAFPLETSLKKLEKMRKDG